jgi:presequence protease
MNENASCLEKAQIGDVCAGFRVMKKEPVAARAATVYTLCHEKTKTPLVYIDRADENKTFAVGFKTLPENDTGVFHILEHSVLNGSKKFPVKEPFVSLLQSSMQTFLNALTYSDMTLYPVSSRNDQDLFNLMAVYLDAVFSPSIYERPEIFMQEGWHYEFGEEPCYNGVVFNEMKGVFADVNSMMDEEMCRLLYPDNSYGYVSGGHPEHIPELTYEQFIATHKRFYHPSNARIILDGHMDVDRILSYINEEYLSHYDYLAPDFDFKAQTPKAAERTVYYEAREGEENLAHVMAGKIFCDHKDTEKILAAKILTRYLTSSNDAPLVRAVLEHDMAQDVSLSVDDGNFQPNITLTLLNTTPEKFGQLKSFLADEVKRILAEGLDEQALKATIDRFAFSDREITEPYGLTMVSRVLSGWLYGEDPLSYLDSTEMIAALREKPISYYADLLEELLGNPEEMSYLYALPSLTKGQVDAQAEADRLNAVLAQWDDAQRQQAEAAFEKMQQWQQQPDTDEVLATLPHLALEDVPETVKSAETALTELAGVKVLDVKTATNGITYMNLQFALSDFTVEELQQLSVLTAFLDELPTEHYTVRDLQTKIKSVCGRFRFAVTMVAPADSLTECTPYLTVSLSTLTENVPQALELLEEVMLRGRYDDADRIQENLAQMDYMSKQALINDGHSFAITKALAATSAQNAYSEALTGESYVNWFSDYTTRFEQDSAACIAAYHQLMQRACAKNRLFVCFAGEMDNAALEAMISALPTAEIGEKAEQPKYDGEDCSIEIPGDVGFSALGQNLNALGGAYTGSCAVLSSMLSYGYLWNTVRVQGGAYGTGISIRASGDIFCYSYRDPNLAHSRQAYNGMADFLAEALEEEMPLDDLIIGTVNTTDPLLSPAETCSLACVRYLRGTTDEKINRIRREILHTTSDDLRKMIDVLQAFQTQGKFCAVGNADAVAFVEK